MLTDLGHIAVWIALAMCLYAIGISLIGAERNDDRFVQSGRVAALTIFPLVLIGCIGLWFALFTHDFSVKYVADVSSLSTPPIFRFTALWGSQNGSILFWCLILSAFIGATMLRGWNEDKAFLPYVTVVCALVMSFFLFLELFLANAFLRYDFPPPDGKGLNPLLRHPGMIIHPPLLYAGYTGMLAPFAFCVASLVLRRGDDLWLRGSRRWTLVGWMFLAAGLALGGRWAHDVLGWGGYWGWDPSENMPLITWLLCTAFLHSQMIQEKRGMFKNWNVVLNMLTFASMFFGTAFIRSGLLTSVHAFAASAIGPWFMGAMTIILVGGAALWLTRLDSLKSDNLLDSAFSREGIFLLQNVIFLSVAFTVFVGTIFPVLSEGIGGTKITVGPPFYDKVAGPQLMILVVLMGVAPLMAWSKANARALGRQAWVPLAIAVVIVFGYWVLSKRMFISNQYPVTNDSPVLTFIPIISFIFCLYSLIQTLFEYGRGAAARMKTMSESAPLALFRLLQKNQRRHGGYFVHLGVALIAIGAIGKGFYGFDVVRNVKLNENFVVGEYAFTYRGIYGVPCQFDDCVTTQAALLVQRDNGETLGGVFPHMDYYERQQYTAKIADVSGSFNEEVYVLLGGWERGGETAQFQVYINPFINWVWVGSIVLMLGFVMSFWKFEPEEKSVAVKTRTIKAAAR